MRTEEPGIHTSHPAQRLQDVGALEIVQDQQFTVRTSSGLLSPLLVLRLAKDLSAKVLPVGEAATAPCLCVPLGTIS
jgi:hypothetical protein